MVFNQGEDMMLIWKFCSRGTVQDIIYNPSLTLDNKFHAAFVRDITLGLEYLHSSPIGYHGSLSPWACLIDRNWMVKLTDFGIANPIERWEKLGLISVNALTSDDDKSGPTQKTCQFFKFLLNSLQNFIQPFVVILRTVVILEKSRGSIPYNIWEPIATLFVILSDRGAICQISLSLRILCL
ncbi:unnamed protein product [Gongylonema pulchrum]|uniref:guanylate cyclase n=1 Tax=Gongylonema pulchrum TaxID=637853 RepID=A0A183DGW5_9BILA|nr:unnamed protein product [Gongylonema pulchrum]